MPDKHLNPFCDISPIKPNHLINNWSVIKSQWSLAHYQVAKCYFNLVSGSYHYQGLSSLSFSPATRQLFITLILSAISQSSSLTPAASLSIITDVHLYMQCSALYLPTERPFTLWTHHYPFLHHTGASGNRATMRPLYLGKLLNQQSIRFHYLVASVRITNDSNDSFRALTKRQNLRGPTHNRRMSSEVYA